jgi:hypothetical protein
LAYLKNCPAGPAVLARQACPSYSPFLWLAAPGLFCIPKHRRGAGVYTLSWAGGITQKLGCNVWTLAAAGNCKCAHFISAAKACFALRTPIGQFALVLSQASRQTSSVLLLPVLISAGVVKKNCEQLATVGRCALPKSNQQPPHPQPQCSPSTLPPPLRALFVCAGAHFVPPAYLGREWQLPVAE